MVEQEAVNFEVAGSSPAVGAKHKHYDESHGVFVFILILTFHHTYAKVYLNMQDESQTENNASAELSPEALLSQMSKKADSIIADEQNNPNLYFGVKKTVSDAGIEVTSLKSRKTAAGLTSAHDSETGATSYELSVLYHGTGDRGVYKYSWSTLDTAVSYAVQSEMNGTEDPILKTDRAEIQSVHSLLENHFPQQELKKDTVKLSLARRVLASLRK